MDGMSTQRLIEQLCEQHPDDVEEFRAAGDALGRERLGTVDRLRSLKDGQWQRLGLPLGIEALLRDEVERETAEARAPQAAARQSAGPQVGPRLAAGGCGAGSENESGDQSSTADGALELEEDDELLCAPQGLDCDVDAVLGPRQRRPRSGSSAADAGRREKQRSFSSLPGGLAPPEDLEALWLKLLEECVDADKRPPLEEVWASTSDAHERYMMFLEYSSYLRKRELTEEEQRQRKRDLEPLLREYGINPEDLEEEHRRPKEPPTGIWWVFFGALFLLAALVHYVYNSSLPDPLALAGLGGFGVG